MARFDQMNGALCATSVKRRSAPACSSPLVNMVNNLGFAPDRAAPGRAGPPRRSERWAGGQLPGLLPAVRGGPEQHCRLFPAFSRPSLGPGGSLILDGRAAPMSQVQSHPGRCRERCPLRMCPSPEPDRPVLEHAKLPRQGRGGGRICGDRRGQTTLVNLLIRAWADGGRSSWTACPSVGTAGRTEPVLLRGAPGDRLFPQHSAGQSALCPPGGQAEVVHAAKLAHATVSSAPAPVQTLMSGGGQGNSARGSTQLLAWPGPW